MSIGTYKTVGADTADELDDQVNEMLGEGWELYGSPYAVQVSEVDGRTERIVYQALVLHDKTVPQSRRKKRGT